MILLSISEAQIHAQWDRIEAKHPWGPMPLGAGKPSDYLLRAYQAGLVTWDEALELYLASVGIGSADL